MHEYNLLKLEHSQKHFLWKKAAISPKEALAPEKTSSARFPQVRQINRQETKRRNALRSSLKIKRFLWKIFEKIPSQKRSCQLRYLPEVKTDLVMGRSVQFVGRDFRRGIGWLIRFLWTTNSMKNRNWTSSKNQFCWSIKFTRILSTGTWPRVWLWTQILGELGS